MTRTALELLNSHYERIESAYTVTDCAALFGPLVVPTGNATERFHSWFRFKEGYSHKLVDAVRGYAAYSWGAARGCAILDPFAGSGTTAVSAIESDRSFEFADRVTSVERNPVMQLVSRAKIAGVALGSEIADRVEESMDDFWLRFNGLDASVADGALSESSTMRNASYFPAGSVATLMKLAVSAKGSGDEFVRDHLLAMVASCVDGAGGLRKDGRALRYSQNKQAAEPLQLFKSMMSRSISDLRSVTEMYGGGFEVIDGDARLLDDTVTPGYDWAIFSPPYPNNIDYTEVYKTEAWVLGAYATAADFRNQRLRTLRSHPSIVFPDEYAYAGEGEMLAAVESIIEPILACIPPGRYAHGRKQVVQGFTDDMLQVMQGVLKALAPNGRAVVVIGNSLHGSGDERFLIAADLIIARLSELCGFRVDEIAVARRPSRRSVDEVRLRESLIFLSAS